MKNINLKEYGRSFCDGKNIYGYGNVRLALHYYKFLVEPNVRGKSILDIGCGDGIIGTVSSADVDYKGLDINAGIYGVVDRPDVKYIPDFSELLSAVEANVVDASLLIDVLEHTYDFTDLFEKALANTRNFVFVTLPNEENIRVRIRFLFGKGIKTHGLDMHGLHINHRHLWLIQIPEAERLLTKVANKHNFELVNKTHFIGYPSTKWKRILYKLVTNFLPWNLKATAFSLTFRKVSQ